MPRTLFHTIVFATALFKMLLVVGDSTATAAEPALTRDVVLRGLTGTVRVDRIEAAPPDLAPLSDERTPDVDLKRMAAWAMHYLISTPRKELGYEPVFQCHPLQCPPVPQGQDVVASCDTDARMNWEWYYMRDISGVKGGTDVEAAFHRRLLQFVQDDGTVLCHPGCFNETDIHKKYEQNEYVIHIWGATKILHALAEDYRRTQSKQSLETGQKIIRRLKSLAVFPEPDRCYLPCGMGAMRQDGTVVPNFWNRHPAPLIEPLINFHLATGDAESLAFAKAYAEGIVTHAQPDGIHFAADGSFAKPLPGHSHATMHALWGLAHLSVVTEEPRYIEFVKPSWDWMLRRGTGTGWFPAMPDNCNETCCISDMMSIAALLGRTSHPEYYDYLERYLRNYICNLQFIVTPEFEAYYRRLHQNRTEEQVELGLTELRKFQGGILGGSGLNDLENHLLGGVSGYEMFGCCAPEGMRAIHTSWENTIERRAAPADAAGVYVNLCLSRPSPWGEVVSFMPDAGRVTVVTAVKDTFYLRPPHWTSREQVRAFRGKTAVPVEWSGAHVRIAADVGEELSITYPLVECSQTVSGLWQGNPDLSLSFRWRGNMVVDVDPPARESNLFSKKPRVLPQPPIH